MQNEVSDPKLFELVADLAAARWDWSTFHPTTQSRLTGLNRAAVQSHLHPIMLTSNGAQ